MDVSSRKERYNQKRTSERICKSSTSDKEDHRKIEQGVKDMLREGMKGTCMLRRMLGASTPGNRWTGREKTRCQDSRKTDMESVGEVDVLDRARWKRGIHNHSGDPV